MTPILAFGSAFENPLVLVIILIVALLLFGRRLPEVGKWAGQSIVEFKKGLKGVTDEMDPIKKDVESVKKDVVDSITKSDSPAPAKPADKPPV